MFSSKTLRQAQGKQTQGRKDDGNWAAKQFKEMAKLRGKLVLM